MLDYSILDYNERLNSIYDDFIIEQPTSKYIVAYRINHSFKKGDKK